MIAWDPERTPPGPPRPDRPQTPAGPEPETNPWIGRALRVGAVLALTAATLAALLLFFLVVVLFGQVPHSLDGASLWGWVPLVAPAWVALGFALAKTSATESTRALLCGPAYLIAGWAAVVLLAFGGR